MPARGAAILSQIEGLLEQLTELDYESPVKDWARQLMPEVSQQADALRSEAETDSPDAELPELDESTADVPPMDREPRPVEEQEKDFAGARDGAKAFLAQAKTEEEQPEEMKKKKRAKAY